jgi:hypothetical protein
MVCVTGQSNQILMDKPMKEILGVNIYTIASWAGDVEAANILLSMILDGLGFSSQTYAPPKKK